MLYGQVSWAPGIGIKKSPFKKLFNEDKGVTYIPWTKLPSSLESLTEGGMIDEDSLPKPPTPPAGDCLMYKDVNVIIYVLLVWYWGTPRLQKALLQYQCWKRDQNVQTKTRALKE